MEADTEVDMREKAREFRPDVRLVTVMTCIIVEFHSSLSVSMNVFFPNK